MPIVFSTVALAGVYDYRLVALSVLLAILASYAALDLAGRVTTARGRAQFVWFTTGSVTMGAGIWAVHYVGMLALKRAVAVLYGWPTVLFSMAAFEVTTEHCLCALGIGTAL
jgi:NO-binding membrane sensor protein with MHYT domain